MNSEEQNEIRRLATRHIAECINRRIDQGLIKDLGDMRLYLLGLMLATEKDNEDENH